MAAALVGCGKTLVGVAGIPVQVNVPSVVAGPGHPGLTSVHAIMIEALAGNAGRVYIGVLGLDKSSLANCLVVLPIPTANMLPTFSISLTTAANALSLSDLWIDADTPGDGVLVSAVVA